VLVAGGRLNAPSLEGGRFDADQIPMTGRHYRITELDAAQRYACRLRATLHQPVRVMRGHGEVVVQTVEDQRRENTHRTPERRDTGE
jgi:hypothetical protein